MEEKAFMAQNLPPHCTDYHGYVLPLDYNI